jgi:hypothetical protein
VELDFTLVQMDLLDVCMAEAELEQHRMGHLLHIPVVQAQLV